MLRRLVPAVLLFGLFAATRVAALQVQFQDSDVNLYARYAAEGQAAGRTGESFYELHRRVIEEEIARSTPNKAAALAEYRSVEYPPLAITVMNVPGSLIDAPFTEELPTGWQPRYTRAYIWMMACFDLATLLLVIVLVRRLYPDDQGAANSLGIFPGISLGQFERCLVYVVCTWPLYGVLYTRLDMGVAFLVTAALVLLVCKAHWCFSFAVLAVAVNFKLMPAVLAPLWVFASLPTTGIGSWREVMRGVTIRAVVLTGFCVVIVAPYYVQHGPAVLEFLDYHKSRGIEIESTWASLLLPAKFMGGEWGVYHSHGSVNVQSPWAPLLATLATPMLACILAVTTGLFVAIISRQRLEAKPSESLTIAQLWPRQVVGFTLVVFFLSIVANKVFSPQYLLWVLPLVTLIDFRPAQRRLYFLATFAACFLTMRIFPDCFVGEIVYVIGRDGDLPLFDGPTPYGALLLVARNAVCVGLVVALASALIRGLRLGGVMRDPALRCGSRLNKSLAAKQMLPFPLR